ncbi:MAG: acylneuraminate cytidylyltransferase family protein [Clostridiales bacterium]|nr:acylneuraminate cytidylyltransferase family protein [Clostridiales bacterium]MBP5417623.1 acylneuraminate cytidylyltransferase family protein [Clostridiales bacterium]
MNILFTICGRAGSKGFKNKNLKEMNGIPLVYYTLAAIYLYKKNHPQDEITLAVNTDSEPLKDLLMKQDAMPIRYIDRKEELAGDTVPKVDVIQDTYFQCADLKPDLVIDLDITSPYRTEKDLENIIEKCNKNDFDIVFSVVEARRSPYFNMVEKKEDGYFRKICSSNYTARQQAPVSYELNASIYAYAPAFLDQKIEKTILDYRCGISVMTDYLVLDIDSEEDFQMMQYLHSFYCKQDSGLNEVYLASKHLYGVDNV